MTDDNVLELGFEEDDEVNRERADAAIELRKRNVSSAFPDTSPTPIRASGGASVVLVTTTLDRELGSPRLDQQVTNVVAG